MQGIKEVASVITGKDQTETEAVLAEKGQEETGQALVREVAGEVRPTEKPSEAAPSEAASTQPTAPGQTTETAPRQTTPATEASSKAETPAQSLAETKPVREEATESAAPAEAQVAYQEYTVKSGDTLSLICQEFYGERNPSLVAEVCKFNGMANANLIYEGQVLKLPKQ